MFNKQKFCHVASNNRNEQKIGLFVYKTTDNLATVTTSGYFNEKIIDINLHDLIIHEQYDAVDRTKVTRNLLCVVERTLDNVGTALIKSDWEKTIEETVNQLVQESETYVKTDGSRIMSAPLRMIAGSMRGAIAPYWNGLGFFKVNTDEAQSVTLVASIDDHSGFVPATDGTLKIGGANKKWSSVHALALNNGHDISIPVTNSAETLALKSEVDLAANSGRMITDQGLWYAKMDSATVAPAAENGTNYADFSQVDTGGNPIIVTYSRVNGAWVQDQTITPPAEYDGYVPITSKIWDIPEQAGQQGGRILWNHQSKEFTPYPQIVSFENISVTGESTVAMPVNPVSAQIVNKDYVDNAIAASGAGKTVGEIFFTTRTDALQGAVECNGGTYDTTDFSGAQSIGDLLTAGKVPYVSLAQYTTLLNTNGSVGVFGWDGGNTTTFRVPTLNDIFIETGTAAEVGDYLAAGLPDHTHQAPYGKNDANDDHAMGNHRPHPATSEYYYTIKGYGLDSTPASSSNAIYGNSNTVQPNAVRYRAMVQLAISATDEAVITCTAITADVAAMKSHEVIDFQAPTAQNNYTWYRKYADGWVEQGGRATTDSGNPCQVTLPVEMADTYYNINILGQTSSDGYTNATWQVMSVSTATTPKSTTSFYGQASITGYNLFFYWEVKGMYAQI